MIHDIANRLFDRVMGPAPAPNGGNHLSDAQLMRVYARLTPKGIENLAQVHGWEETRRYVQEMDKIAERTGLYGGNAWPTTF